VTATQAINFSPRDDLNLLGDPYRLLEGKCETAMLEAGACASLVDCLLLFKAVLLDFTSSGIRLFFTEEGATGAIYGVVLLNLKLYKP